MAPKTQKTEYNELEARVLRLELEQARIQGGKEAMENFNILHPYVPPVQQPAAPFNWKPVATVIVAVATLITAVAGAVAVLK